MKLYLRVGQVRRGGQCVACDQRRINVSIEFN